MNPTINSADPVFRPQTHVLTPLKAVFIIAIVATHYVIIFVIFSVVYYYLFALSSQQKYSESLIV